jgi:hypothetical protein
MKVPEPPRLQKKDESLLHKNSFSKEDLIKCGEGGLFGPGRAQLPVDKMLMVDRITEISQSGGRYGKGEIRAEMDINEDLWFLAVSRFFSSLERKLGKGQSIRVWKSEFSRPSAS